MRDESTPAAGRQELVESFVRHLEAGGSASPAEFLAERGIEDDDVLDALRLAGLLETRVRSEPLEGARLGPYRLIRRLGAGGMATVYEAVVEGRAARLHGGERVALKLVHPRLFAKPGYFARFLREADVGRRVEHPNVVRVLTADAVEHGAGTAHLLAMEYVEGRTLRELQADLGVVPEVLLREIALQIAEGLSAIHQAGVVHRDLKPENVLITKDHDVRIMDLGVARVLDGTATLTLAGEFVGSLAYAAPEQFKDGEIGPPADLYSLGVTLYELATGVNPFQRDEFSQVMAAHLGEAPRRADEVREDLSPFLAELLATLLAKDATARVDGAAELAEILRAGESSAWWAERERRARPETARIPRVPVQRQTKLHGREEDLALLHAAWERARSGDGNTVYLEGEAGIGKSRLVDAFLHEVTAPDLHVLYGSYPPTGGMGGLSDAVLEHFGAAGLVESLGPYLTITPSLIPGFAAIVSHQRAPDGAEPLQGDALHAVFVHLMRALAAERPLVWVVDDLHFASEDGRKIVLSLARAVEGHPVLLLVTARPGVDEGELAHFSRLRSFQRTKLRRLGARDVVELLREAFQSHALAEKLGATIAYKSDGVPFFVFEMIRGLREGQFITQQDDGTWVETKVIDHIEVPSAVRDLIGARLRGLTDDRRAVLDVGAVCGFEFDPDIVARVLGRRHIAVLQDLAAIERRSGVITGGAGRSRFDHHQIQEVLYESVPPALRTAYHAEIAAALESRAGAADVDPDTLDGALCVELCDHYLNGARGEDALRYLELARAHLVGSYSNVLAVDLVERVLAVPGLLAGCARAETLLRACSANAALDVLGLRPRQSEFVREAECLAEEAEDDVLRWRAAAASGNVLFRTSRLDEAEAAYRRALGIVRALGDRRGEGAVEAGLGAVLLEQRRLSGARTALERSRLLAREFGDLQAEGVAVGNLGTILFFQDRLSDAFQYYERYLRLTRECGDRIGEVRATSLLGNVLYSQDRLDDARVHFTRSLALAREIGHRECEAIATGNLGVLCLAQSRLSEARDYTAAYLAQSRELGSEKLQSAALANLGAICVRFGDYTAARCLLEQSVAMCGGVGMRHDAAIPLLELATIADEQNDGALARELVEDSLARRRESGHVEGIAGALIQLGALLSRSGDADAAREALGEALALLRANEIIRGIAAALCASARLRGGDAGAARAALAEAGSVCDSPAQRLDLFRATGDLSELRKARRLLEESLEHAPEEYRESMCRNVRVNREILAAWRQEFGEEGEGHAPADSDSDDDAPDASESATRFVPRE